MCHLVRAITYLLVQWHKSLMVEWQLAWDNHSLWAEIWTQDLQNTEDWSAIYSEIICETKF